MDQISIQSDNIEIVDINHLIPHPKNMHEHSPEQIERLCEILKYQGFRTPLTVQKGTNLIVCGHGRMLAAQKLGMSKLPVSYQEFDSEAQLYAHIVADNAIGKDTWASLDLGKINLDIQDLGPDLDIEMLGLKDFEVEPMDRLDPQTDEDAVPEVQHPITRRGDIWLLGNHRVLCGDSTMIDDVEKLMAGEKADMVFTDPPYNQTTTGGEKGEIGASLRKQSAEIESMCNFEPEDFLDLLPTVFEKNKINAFVFCNKDLVVNYLQWARDMGYAYNILFWKKPNAIPLGGSYRPDVEYLIIFRKSGIFNSGISDCSYSKCLEFGREKNKVHPTMKPVEMIENQLLIASNRNSIVGEFFLGSGSTLIACEKTNRKCYGMELDEKYCDVIINRWQEYTGKTATLEATGQTYTELKVERDATT